MTPALQSSAYRKEDTVNVIVIAIDTLRADHLGCYGYAQNTSPNIDAFAQQSTLVETAFAPAIPTHPAFATINTGQYAITHGIVAQTGHNPLPRNGPWLPRVMQQAGYTTCAVDNLPAWRNGFGRGYEFCIDPTMRRNLNIACDNREINRRAVPWLEHHKDERFFLFIHYWDPHTPYLPPRAYRTLYYKGNPSTPDNHSLDALRSHPLGKTWAETWFNKFSFEITDAEYVVALYDGEIRYCDEGIGQLLKKLEELGLAEDTLVVLLSDHGELMYRHGIFFDHHGLYDGNLHVPLIFRCPGVPPRRVPVLAEHVDIAPTILDLCGIEAPNEMEGHSLAAHLRGETVEPIREYVVSQECTWQMKWAIRTARHKFILAREPDYYGTPMRELYDLQADPDEMDNLVDEQPLLAQKLEADLEAWIARKMKQNGLAEDPLVAHGITLGAAWRQPDSQDL